MIVDGQPKVPVWQEAADARFEGIVETWIGALNH
jgi:hypothetical protein